MKSYLESLGTVLLTGMFFLGMGARAGAQQGPPASQQPMEIPAQYPPQQQGGAQPQGGPEQAQQNDSGAARISFVQGDVSTQHSGSNDWTAATQNTPVVNGDQISTGQNARAEIQLDHANILRMADQTTANVVSLARNQMQVQVGQGLLNYDILKNNDSGVEIQTPNVAIRPQMGEGSYRIQVNSDNETVVDVRRGSAEISTPQGSTIVQRDQRITVQGSADTAQYQVSGPSSRDDWDKWNTERDRNIEKAQSWQHTNPYYTGTQDLDASGQWNDVPDYGAVWFPSEGPDWAPYRDGRWVYEPYYGWTWVSYEPWGWAPYHYGRWFVYGGNWGWWPGPVYAGYQPIWAPAYVSFFGFGGGGWGVNLGFGFGGGFGNVGWLPCGPGDRFYPWYGRGVNRVNMVNVYNVHNNYYGGMNPLREGSRGYSNVDRAFSDQRVRAGISSMQSNQFGRGRVPMQQSRIDAGSFRQARLMTGANPVSPTRQSFQSTDRQVSPSSIPSRVNGNQRFFSSAGRQNTSVQAGRGASNFNRGGNPGGNQAQQNTVRPGFRSFGQTNSGNTNPGNRPGGFNASGNAAGNVNRGPASQQMSRPSHAPNQAPNQGQRGFGQPSGQQNQSNGGRAFEGQSGAPPRSNYPQQVGPPRQNQNNPRGGYSNNGNSRPTLNMQQPVVTSRGGGSYSSPAMRGTPGGGGYSVSPRGGGYPGGGPRGGSNVGSAPSGGGYSGPRGGGYSGGGPRGGSSAGRAPSGGGSRGGWSGGGSRGGNSGGGSHGGSSGSGHR